MKRIVLPLVAMALSAPVSAQTSEPAWHGWHGGVQLDVFADGDYNSPIDPAVTGDWEGVVFGFFAGYRYQFSSFVIGGEYDLVFGSPEGTISGGGATVDVTAQPTIHRLAAEFGYAASDVLLPYATAGFTYLSLDAEAGTNDTDGYFAGVGLDYRYRPGVTIGVELLSHDYGGFSLAPDIETEFTTLSVNWGVDF